MWAGHPDGFLQVNPMWAGHPDGFLQVNPMWAGHPDGFLQVCPGCAGRTLTGSSRLRVHYIIQNYSPDYVKSESDYNPGQIIHNLI